MRRPRATEIALVVLGIAATVLAVRGGLRYGDQYHVGDGIYRHDHAADVLRVAVPAAVAAVALAVLVLSLLTPAGLREQWRRERRLRTEAQAWSRQDGPR